jgi:hypothetical protein
MRRSIYAIFGVAFFSLLALGSSPANALPPASGSKCKPDWVSNQGAMSCFIQGEEDVRNGVRHPHYVACTAAGEIFCCVDDDRGNQSCDIANAGARPPSESVKVGALLDAQQTILTKLGEISKRLDSIEGALRERKSSP